MAKASTNILRIKLKKKKSVYNVILYNFLCEDLLNCYLFTNCYYLKVIPTMILD